MKKDAFRVVPVVAPNGAKGTVHLAISDSTGDSAIFEYVKGKLVIHHGKEFQVMTDSPIYDKQLAINEYWREFDGAVMLPGTVEERPRTALHGLRITLTRASSRQMPVKLWRPRSA